MKLANLTSERAVLGTLLQCGSSAYYDCADILGDDIFTDFNHQVIFRVINSILEESDHESISAVDCLSRCEGMGHSRIKPEYLQDLVKLDSPINTLRTHVATLRKLSIARNLTEIQSESVNKLSKVTGVETYSEIISLAEGPISDFVNGLGDGDLEPTILQDKVDEFFDFVMENPVDSMGVSLGFPTYEECIGGFRPGLHIIAARTKAGKSMLLDNMATNAQVPSLNIDTEMTWDDHMVRILAMLSGVASKRIETGQFQFDPEELEAVKQAREKLKDIIPLLSHNSVGDLRFDEHLGIMRRWVNRLKREGKDGVIFYDYIKLTDGDTKSTKFQEYQLLGFKASALQSFAKKYNVPVISFAQQNRKGIDSDSDDTIAGSDRIAHLCVSLGLLRAKNDNEIAQDGVEKGNRKLIPVLARHSGTSTEYVNLQLEGWKATIAEISPFSSDFETSF